MSKSGPKRTVIQRERDRREIANLYLQGWIQADIAARLNESEDREYTLTQQMISYDLLRLQEGWRESALIDINEAKSRELAKIDRLEREGWSEWQKSHGLPGALGDPRYLSVVQWCIEQRCKILGVNAPTRQVLTAQMFTTKTTKELSDAELMAIAGAALPDSDAADLSTGTTET